MKHAATAYALILALVFASLSLADARGAYSETGTEMVICSGVTMTTITVGADGQPIEQTHVCPDGTSLFAADFTLPKLVQPTPVLLRVSPVPQSVSSLTRDELTPSARGPPQLV